MSRLLRDRIDTHNKMAQTHRSRRTGSPGWQRG